MTHHRLSLMKSLLFAVCFVAMLAATVCRAAPTGPAIVADRRGNVVGQYFPAGPKLTTGDFALLKIEGFRVFLPVSKSGFVQSGLSLLYTASDCSGTAYLFVGFGEPQAEPEPLTVVAAGVAGTTLYF